MPRRSSKANPLVDPSVTLVSTQQLDSHMLRAFVISRPGGAPELHLERIDFGDEAEPFVVVRHVEVQHSALNTIDAMRWTDERLYFSEISDSRGEKQWSVRATSQEFETKATRVD